MNAFIGIPTIPNTVGGVKFVLRPFRDGDEISLQFHINSPQVARDVSNIPYPYTIERALQWIAHMKEEQGMKIPRRIDFAIDINGEVIGSIAFINVDIHKAQISYWLGVKHWGKGIMTNAVKLLLKYGFEVLNIVRIYAFVYHHNLTSMRVLMKAGLRLEGVHQKVWFKQGKYYDSYMFAKINPDFKEEWA